LIAIVANTNAHIYAREHCAERNHQQPLVGFIKLRIAIHSEKQNETESVHQHAFKATHE